MAQVFSRLLLATEHSEYDSGAEALAFELARRCGLPLAGIVPIVSNPEYEALAPQLAARADKQAREHIAALQSEAQRQGVAFEPQARRGAEPYLEIVDAAREHNADLLIIRRRGRRGLLANLLVGEMVSLVVAHAPCSVLIAPRAARMWSKRVLVAIDPRAPELRLATLAARVAGECQLPLSVACVLETESADARRQAESVLQQARAAAGVDVTTLLRVGRAHEQILAAASDQGADLIMLARHGPTRVARAWIGGVAQKVIGLADWPVLVSVMAKESAA